MSEIAYIKKFPIPVCDFKYQILNMQLIIKYNEQTLDYFLNIPRTLYTQVDKIIVTVKKKGNGIASNVALCLNTYMILFS